MRHGPFPGFLLAMLVLFVPGVGAQEARELFQQALLSERVDGNPEGSIDLYLRVATETNDRDLAARALLRAGGLYEILGSPEAAATYERLVRDFADQGDAVDEARDRLAAMSPASGQIGGFEDGLAARRIWGEWMNWSLSVGAVSPNGREIAATYWEPVRPGTTGDLVVVDAETGDLRVVGRTSTAPGADTYAVGYSWSRDGARLAYSEWSVGKTPNHQELHVANADGSGQRLASSNAQYWDIQPHSWSADGRWLVALVTGWDDVARIATISLDDGSVTVVKTLRNGFDPGQRARMSLSLSRDDRYVAYAYAPSPGDEPDVHVLAVDGSGETVIAAHGATEQNPLWTPDGSRLVFLSNRSGSADFWAVEMSEGEAAGEPYVVHSQVGPVWPLGFTDDGALMYHTEVRLGQLGIVDLDERGAHFETATPLTDRFVGSNSDPVWSPDGTRVAFFASRAETGLDRNRYLVVRSLEDGSEKDVALSMGRFFGGHGSRPQWSADGRSVLFQGVDRELTETGVTSRHSGYRVDVETGNVHREPHLWSSQSFYLDVTGRQSERLRSLGIRIDGFKYVSEAIVDGADRLGPEERLLWMRGHMGWRTGFECDPKQTYEGAVCLGPRMLIEPIAGDAGEPRLDRGYVGRWHLSPDGGRIAYFLRDALDPSAWNLWVRSVTMDDEPRLLVAGPSCFCELKWTPDGRHILYVEEAGGGDRWDPVPVQRVSVDGGAPVELPWKLAPEQLALLSFDPEGRRAVMPLMEESGREDIWSLSGFPWQDADGRN